MLCQKCGLTEATVHREHVVYRQKIEEHLCSLCAGSGGKPPDKPPFLVTTARSAAVDESPLPASVQLPNQIVVRQLAELLGIAPFRIVSLLMEEGAFVTLNRLIGFELAARVCARLGISATRSGEPL